MEIIYIIFALVLIALGYWFWQRRRKRAAGLPVLMYHKVISAGEPDFLSIKRTDLEAQFQYLKSKGYNTILLSELEQYLVRGTPLPANPCLISFDDGYRNNYTEMFPLLVKYGLKANIFLVASFLDDSAGEYLRTEEVLLMAKSNVEYGLHSLKHDSYKNFTLEAIKQDVDDCRAIFKRSGIVVQPALAYTYGAYPKSDSLKLESMFTLFESLGIRMAFRIGNRKNPLPLTEKFLVQRLDIRGDENMHTFISALRFGKKPF